ncbi:MAG: hypothetical protein ACLTX6_00710 [Lachnospiraceae bacterium]
MKYLLGIDNGGTFSKAAIFDENGEQISVASVPTETLTQNRVTQKKIWMISGT